MPVTDFCVEEVKVWVDADMMETALRNVISNAIKYTHAMGRIMIKVKQSEDKCIVEITDNGIGMDHSSIQNLYHYDELHTKGTAGEMSSGIALFITKDFLDKNGASVQVESEVGEGTTFRITI